MRRLELSHALMRAGQARRMLQIKAVRGLHAKMRAEGRVPGQEARAALAAKRLQAKMQGQTWRVSNVNE